VEGYLSYNRVEGVNNRRSMRHSPEASDVDCVQAILLSCSLLYMPSSLACDVAITLRSNGQIDCALGIGRHTV